MKFVANSFIINYVFTPTKQVIDFSGEPGFHWTRLQAILALTQNGAPYNNFLYVMGVPGFGATPDVSGKILTLQQSTVGFVPGDTLNFVMDDGDDFLSDISKAAGVTIDPDLNVPIQGYGLLMSSIDLGSLLRSIISELRVISHILHEDASTLSNATYGQGAGALADELDNLRDSYSYTESEV